MALSVAQAAAPPAQARQALTRRPGVTASSSRIRMSTEMFPENERFCAFREEFVRHLAMDVIEHSGGRRRVT
jgi:hypothetical protein